LPRVPMRPIKSRFRPRDGNLESLKQFKAQARYPAKTSCGRKTLRLARTGGNMQSILAQAMP
jgi:hypothetical protein